MDTEASLWVTMSRLCENGDSQSGANSRRSGGCPWAEPASSSESSALWQSGGVAIIRRTFAARMVFPYGV